jgi:uncharacterized protein YndB with AHSA1/START domain
MSDDAENVIRPPALELSRVFKAPRALVFAAWSTTEHIKRWFCPEEMTIPDATVEFRPGGVFDVCMRAPDGVDFWMRGHFLDITAPERLVFAADVVVHGTRQFFVNTTVTFTEEGGGTLMSVRQLYEIYNPDFHDPVGGAREGWRSTLDRLEKLLG